jgi:glycosyltransferase involved in cell wall biosynthesis
VKALYFGTYDRAYPRNAQVISCLRHAGVEVSERHRPLWGRRHNWSLGLGQLFRVAIAERRLRRERERDADVLIVGYPGHFDMNAALRVARGRPVVFNPLVSLYDTLVADRGRFRRGMPAAGVLRHVDRNSFGRASVVVADTKAHAAFFAAAFDLPPSRLAVCFVGAEDRLFRPGWQPEQPFHALFVGKLIPLHGVETILAAARLVPEIPFRLVGSGQLEHLLSERPPNVNWTPWLEYEDLPAAYQVSGCALGIFGSGEKAARVIPNKAFQALACARPLVTADTPAARELLTDGVDTVLVPSGDPEALAAAVHKLAGDTAYASSIGEAGRATYEAHASEEVLGARWRELLERVVHKQ